MSENKEQQINWYKLKSDLELQIKILEEEVDALRSICCESNIKLKYYTQWHKAETLKKVRNYLK